MRAARLLVAALLALSACGVRGAPRPPRPEPQPTPAADAGTPEDTK